MLEFKCANCKKVIQFNEKDPISLRCNSCDSGEVIFQDRISRQCIVCKAEEVVEPGTKIHGRHDCWGRGYVWVIKEKNLIIKDDPSLKAAKQSFVEKIRTIINSKEKVADTLNEPVNLEDSEAEKDEEPAPEVQPDKLEEEMTGDLGFDEQKEEPEIKETIKPPVAKKSKKEATPFKRRGRG